MLYTEEITGFPTQKVVELRCEFFGLSGHYALRLKPSEANPSAPTTSAYVKVSVLVFPLFYAEFRGNFKFTDAAHFLLFIHHPDQNIAK